MQDNLRTYPREGLADLWIWLGGIAVLLLLGYVFFGSVADGYTNDVHPGGAGDEVSAVRLAD